MTFPAYPIYQESGIDWIGAIPHSWPVKALRGLAREGRTSFIDGDWIETPFIADDGIRLIQTGNIGVGHYREQGFRFITEATFAALGCTEVMPGDVMICRLADPVGRACLAPDLGCRMVTSVDVCILKPAEDVLNRFVVYLLSSRQYLGFMEGQCRGGTRDRVSRSFLGAVRVPLPPLPEQSAIAAFLDRETGKIDALVAEQERLIALLKEKRQAVISQAVTKGLDPSAPMKDSGVPWLGQVPARWEVTRLKYAALCDGTGVQIGPFGGMLKDLPNAQTGYKLYGQQNIISGDFEAGDRWITEETFLSNPVYQIREGDLLVTRKGSLGNCRPVPANAIPGWFDSDSICVRLDPAHAAGAYIELLSHDAEYVAVQIDQTRRGAILSGINTNVLSNLVIVLPPLDEQPIVLAAIAQREIELNTLTTEAYRAIDLLRERRAALISAAVTGKIDVRGLVTTTVSEAA